jgi:hypothetical protein
MGRWLKTIMKKVIAMAEKGIELGEKISNIGVRIYGI